MPTERFMRSWPRWAYFVYGVYLMRERIITSFRFAQHTKVKTIQKDGFYFGAKEATLLEHLYNIAQWIFEHGKSELFIIPDIAPLPLEKLLPEKQYAF